MVTRRIRGVRLTREERLAVRRLIDTGCSFEQAAAAVRCSTKTVQRALNAVGGLRPRPRVRSPRQLSLAEREDVSRELRRGASYREIARRLYRAPSTICREVNRNGGPCRYRAVRADDATHKRARRPKAAKLRSHPRLRAQVEAMLTALWSPEQISARLKVEYPDDPRMRVSHETIYQSLFVQTRGALRRNSRPVCAPAEPDGGRMGARTPAATSKRWC
jgi:IS30 family transposase